VQFTFQFIKYFYYAPGQAAPMMRLVAILTLVTMIQGCVSVAREIPAQDTQQLQVFYATDRKPQKTDTPGVYYGSKRGNKIQYGIATVDVWPIDLEEENADGEIRKITSKTIDTAFSQANQLGKNRFFKRLRDPAHSGKTGDIMLFVHGFKRNFRAAAENAALVSASIGFGGATVFWSWPSLDNAAGYLTDRTTLLWSQKHLAQFITELVEEGRIQRLVLVAHSLGTQALTQALFEEIGTEQLSRWKVIDNLVLMAPDIDLGIFRRDIVPGINQLDIPTTVYASATDWALITSSSLNGYPRAGDSSEKVYTFPGIDTIDATLVKQSFLGHSYYRRSFAVIDDLHFLIVRKKPIRQRPGLVSVKKKDRLYWKLE
jgi:esterase/lipase superfamily enzyme